MASSPWDPTGGLGDLGRKTIYFQGHVESISIQGFREQEAGTWGNTFTGAEKVIRFSLWEQGSDRVPTALINTGKLSGVLLFKVKQNGHIYAWANFGTWSMKNLPFIVTLHVTASYFYRKN